MNLISKKLNMDRLTLLTGLLVTSITASLVTSSVAFVTDSADADRGDKIKEKIKKIIHHPRLLFSL
jgi:hypothetical protein